MPLANKVKPKTVKTYYCLPHFRSSCPEVFCEKVALRNFV